MSPLIKLPKYALFDFDDGTVDTGASSLIDTVESEISEQTFDYDASHIIFWPNRPLKNSSQEEIVKLKQCGKVLLFGSDLLQLKQYRDLLSNDIIAIQKFPEIRKKQWSKSTVDDNAKSYPGAGERQSRRLKALKQLTEDETVQNSPQVSKPQKKAITKKRNGQSKSRCQSLSNKTTLENIAQQQAILSLHKLDKKPDDTGDVAQCNPAIASGSTDETRPNSFRTPKRKLSEDSQEEEDDAEIFRDLNHDASDSNDESSDTSSKRTPSPKSRKLSTSSAKSMVDLTSSDNWDNRDPPTLTRAENVSVDSTLAALKADILHPTCEDKLQKKIRDLEQENQRLRRDLLFCQEFNGVKVWIDQLIYKYKSLKNSNLEKEGEECSRPVISSAKMKTDDLLPTISLHPIKNGAPTLPAITETVKMESSASDELRGSLASHKFPITQDLIDEIPTRAKKTDSHFVAKLLRLLYTEEYLATHTMGANLTGKECMEETEVDQIIDATVKYFNYKSEEKEAKIKELRKTISTTLNNTKQKVKNKKTCNK